MPYTLIRWTRITSYNVCYTKLLRDFATLKNAIHLDSMDINGLIQAELAMKGVITSYSIHYTKLYEMSDELGNIEAERIYLKEKQKAPFKTDLKYFFKAVYNILTRKIVSG